MLLYNNLPMYEMTLDGVDGIQLMSIVTHPAIEVQFLKFGADQPIEQKFSFDDDKHIITGPAMIPDLPIYRRNGNEEFYVTFSADTIKQLEEKFMADRKTLSVNIEHSIPTDDCVITESYFINHERGIAPEEFTNLPDGTWMLSMKVNNDAIWTAIKDGQLNGFSIEGIFFMKELDNALKEEAKPKDNCFMDWILKQINK